MSNLFSSLISQFGILPVVGGMLLLWLGYRFIDVLIDDGIRPWLRRCHVRKAVGLSEKTKLPPELVLPLVVPPADNKSLIGLAELKSKLKP